MKKIGTLFLLFICIILAGCGNTTVNTERPNDNDESHNHSLTHIVAKEATCTETGNIEYWYCSGCDKYFSDNEANNEISASSVIVSPKGHTLAEAVRENEVASTCTTAGSFELVIYCSVCHEEISRTKVELTANGHATTHTVAKEATCTEAGNIEYWHCSVCDKYFSDKECTKEVTLAETVVPALEHDLVHHNGQPATCIEAGYEAYDTCSRCVYTTYQEIPAKGHTPSAAVKENEVAATCTTPGSYDLVVYCSDCKEKISSTHVDTPALGHTTTHTLAKQPTCTEAGNIEYWYCSVCEKYFSDKDYKTEVTLAETVIPALNHDLVHHEGKDATCTEAGYEAYETCSRCDYSTYKEIPALGHTLDHTEYKAATYSEAGNIEYWYCSVCKKYYSDVNATKEITLNDTIIAPLQHSLAYYSGVAATCTTPGNIEYWYCTECNKYFSDKACTTEVTLEEIALPALDHELVHHDGKDATCTEAGYEAYETCSRCDYSTYKEIPALGHNLVHHDGKEATCTEVGYEAYDTCSRCDYSTYKEIPAKGHTPKDAIKENEEASTCTTPGSYDLVVYCSVCKEKISSTHIETPALGHSLTYYPGVAATCTTPGNIEYWYCSVCEKYFSDKDCTKVVTLAETVIPALGHALVNHDGQAATCTEAGYEAYDTCSRCDYSTYKEIPALGHTPEAAVKENEEAPTCTTAGSYDSVVYCSVCDEKISSTHIEIPALGHNLTYYPGVAETCTTSGNIEYWYCSVCKKYFRDEAGSSEVALEETLVPALGHDYDENGTCSVCGLNRYLGYAIKMDEDGNEYVLIASCDTSFSGDLIIPSKAYGYDVRGIANYAFSDCYNINKIVLPDTIESLDLTAFRNAIVNELVLPSSITYIYQDFTSYNIEKINYLGDLEGWLNIEREYNFYSISSSSTELYFNGQIQNDIVIPEGITKINKMAFSGIASLTSVILPSTLQSIGFRAFASCRNLASVYIPTNVTDMGGDVFSYSNKAVIYCEVESEPSYWSSDWNYTYSSYLPVIWNCITNDVDENGNSYATIDGLRYSLNKNTQSAIVLGSANYLVTDINIPASISITNDETVDNAISYDVVGIGTYAFSYCDTLATITFETNSKLTTIGTYAFSNCYNLTSITIPASVESIESNAFYYCRNLATITFEANSKLATIGEYAFSSCYSLTTINYLGNLSEWLQINDLYYLMGFGSSNKKLYIDNLLVSGEIEIPNGVTNIPRYAFSGCSALTKITIPTSVENIADNAFYRCPSLIIYCKAKEEEVAWSSNWNYDSYNGINIPVIWDCDNNEVTSDGYIYTTIGDLVYKLDTNTYEASILGLANTNVEDLTIPDTVEYQRKTSDDTELNEYSVTSILARAFENKLNLLSVNIPSTIKYIGSYAFYQCYKAVIMCDFTGKPNEWTYNCFYSTGYVVYTQSSSNVYSFEIIDGLRYAIYYGEARVIGQSTSLSGSVSIPSSVTSIAEYAFSNCSSLTTVVFDENIQLTSIENNAFSGCSSLTSMEIPSSVTSIEYDAFYGCSQLTSITIPSSVTKIGYSAFYYCNNLATIKYQGDITSWLQMRGLDNLMRYGSSSIELYINGSLLSGELIIPEGVRSIPDSAFENCSQLTSIIIPSSVTKIGNYAFYKCYNLNIVIFEPNSELTSIGDCAFYNCSSLKSIEIPSTVISIGSSAFYNCSQLTIVTISENSQLNSIGAYAFYYCRSLTGIVIPDGITSIEERTFYYCRSLTNVIFPSSLTNIEDYTFYRCSSLTSIEIPLGVTSIGYDAFYGCISLTSITIPSSITSIGNSAFDDCSNLATINYLGNATSWVQINGLSNLMQYSSSSKELYIKGELPTNVVIEEGPTSIPRYAFSNCSLLTSITIPSSVESIGNNAFKGCSSLTSITIPSSVTRIGGVAFDGCSSLPSITIPSSVTSIGGYAFIGCSSLTIYCEAVEQPSGWYSSWNYSNCPVNWGSTL